MKRLIIITLALVTMATLSFEVHAQTRRQRTAPRRSARARAARQPAASNPSMTSTTTSSGLTYLITKRGTGRQPKTGEIVVVHYTGTLTNGVKFDSSRDRGEPFAFKLGAGQVIKGWDEGIAALHIGDQAILVIPSQLGYGERGAGGGAIPPDAMLIFIVELVDIKATSLAEVLSQTMKEKGVEATVAQYREMKTKGLSDIYSSESDMNGWGYRLLRNRQFKEAIEVFKLDVEAYPKSANVYDSLAEAYLASGNNQAAIENYNKALEIDPQLESARKVLRLLTGK
ncbi:MAG TPA: FKBP-type peptidyl-prolyl cis-trans isomerase [Pyrinomonadaceae bacterium]